VKILVLKKKKKKGNEQLINFDALIKENYTIYIEIKRNSVIDGL